MYSLTLLHAELSSETAPGYTGISSKNDPYLLAVSLNDYAATPVIVVEELREHSSSEVVIIIIIADVITILVIIVVTALIII